MKKRISQFGQLILLAAIPLLAVSPTLARVNYHAHGQTPHCMKAGPCCKFFPTAGLRAGRLNFTPHSKGASQRNPEDVDYTPRVFTAKAAWTLGNPSQPLVSTTAFTPRNFLVLRI